MPYNEADTRAKLIDPAQRQRGWTEDLVFCEQTAGSIVLDGMRARRLPGRVDYLLRVRVNPGTQPVPLALIEAKAEARRLGVRPLFNRASDCLFQNERGRAVEAIASRVDETLDLCGSLSGAGMLSVFSGAL